MRSKLIMMLFAYGNFWSAVCVSLQAPFFPREAEMKGATPSQYGFVFAIYELVIIVMSPIVGKFLSPRVPAKPMITIGLLIISVAVIIFGLLDRVPEGQPFIVLAYTIRCLEALGAVIFTVANNTAVAALFPQNVATAFSVLETGFGLGLIVGPTVGSALYACGGYTLPFATLGSLLFVGSVCIFFVLPDPPEADQYNDNLVVNGADSSKFGLTNLLSDFGCILDVLAIISAFTFLGFNAAFLEPHLRQFNVSILAVGFIFIIDGGIFALTSPIVGRICDIGFNPRFFIIAGHLLMALGIAFIGPLPMIPATSGPWLVCASLAAVGAGVGLKFVPAFFNCLSQAVHRRGFPDDKTTYALVSSLVFSCGSLGSFVGPCLGGYLYDWYGYRYASCLFLIIELMLGALSVCYANISTHFPGRDNKRSASSKTSSLDFEKSFTSERQPLLAHANRHHLTKVDCIKHKQLIMCQSADLNLLTERGLDVSRLLATGNRRPCGTSLVDVRRGLTSSLSISFLNNDRYQGINSETSSVLCTCHKPAAPN